MPTVVLPIANQRVTSDNALVPSSIVGTAPWDDSDDGTYTEATLSVRSGGTQADEHLGDIAAQNLSGASSWSAELDVTLTNSGGASGLRGSIQFYEQGYNPNTDSPKFTLSNPGNFYYTTSVSGVKATKTFTTVYEGLNVADLAAALSTPTVVVFSRYTVGFAPPADYTSRIHRFVMTFEVDGRSRVRGYPIRRSAYPGDKRRRGYPRWT